jgi:hypothetical protein
LVVTAGSDDLCGGCGGVALAKFYILVCFVWVVYLQKQRESNANAMRKQSECNAKAKRMQCESKANAMRIQRGSNAKVTRK